MDFVLFKFRNGLLQKIKDSSADDLERFQEYDLTKKEIVLVWAIQNDITSYTEIENFVDFHSDDALADEKKKYLADYKHLVAEQKEAEKLSKKFVDKIVSTKSEVENFSPFVATRNNVVINFSKIRLYPTERIPMIKAIKTEHWTRLWRGYTNFEELNTFFEGDEQGPTHVFKIPQVDKGTISIPKSQIEVQIEPKETDRVVELIQKDLKLKVKDWHREYINGGFTIRGLQFDWQLLAMMIVQKNFYDNRIILTEEGEILSQKDRFPIKYYKWGPKFSRAVFFTLANVKNDLVVKIAKIPQDTEIDFSVKLILTVLTDYIDEEENMIAIYKEHMPSFKTQTKAKKVVEKEFKTKLRLENLKKFNPDLFGQEYMRQCIGPTRQPRIPTEKEAERLLREKPDEIIEFPFGSKIYYTCLPFEKTKEGVVNKYPGLVKNKNPDATNKYLPCCYPQSHHARVNSVLNKYISEQTGLGGKSEKVKTEILDVHKRLPEKRRGLLPERLKKILEYAELDTENYIRYGVHASPQSIIDAMAMIADYDEWFDDSKAARQKIIDRLIRSPMLSACVQSYSLDYIQNALATGGEIGAAEFHPVVEYFFKSTVVVIDGTNLTRPTSKFGFIAHLRKRTNLIIFYMHPGYNQVEVIGTYKKEFKTYPQKTINAFLEIKRQCFGYFSPKKFVFPRIFKIANRATSQYVDSFGKNRGFVVDGQTIFMPPSAPIAKPIVHDIFISKTKSIMEEFGETAIYFKDGLVYSENFVFPSRERDLPPPPEDFIAPYIVSTTNFIKSSLKAEKSAPKDLFRKDLELDSNKIVTIYPQDEEGYLQIIKQLPAFRWEKLANMKWNPGQIHWLSIHGQNFIVQDVDEKPLESEQNVGTWSVALDNKVSDNGHFIEYPNGKFGLIL